MIVFLLISAAFTTFGQNITDAGVEKPFIEVTGTAEKEIIPDEIYIAITIRERNEGREKITIDKQEADLLEALKNIGISVENLSLSDANADYIRVRWTKKDVITKAGYVIKVGDAQTVGKVFEKLDELKIEDAYISKVSHSKLEEFKKDVRIMAIKAAKEKADYLLAAIGQQTGKALKVYEVLNPRMDETNINIRGARTESSLNYIEGVKVKEVDKEIQFQKIKLQAAIYVKFGID